MDARLVGGGVAPGQSPSQLTPLGGTYKKSRVSSAPISSTELVKSGVSEATSTGKGLVINMPYRYRVLRR